MVLRMRNMITRIVIPVACSACWSGEFASGVQSKGATRGSSSPRCASPACVNCQTSAYEELCETIDSTHHSIRYPDSMNHQGSLTICIWTARSLIVCLNRLT